MASFTRVISKKSGNHGNKVSVDGKVRGKKIPQATFVRIAKENNGDIRKISDILFGEEKGKLYANTTKQRYEKLQEEYNLPPMVFKQLRKHTEMTPQLQKQMISAWQKFQGDATKVAETIGVSAQTIVSWVAKFDKLYFERNISAVMEKFECSREEALDKMTDAEGNVSFVTPLYEKKIKPRGKKSANLETSVLEDIEIDVENLLNEVEERSEEKEELEKEMEELGI